jgi:hypothetical protein
MAIETDTRVAASSPTDTPADDGAIRVVTIRA